MPAMWDRLRTSSSLTSFSTAATTTVKPSTAGPKASRLPFVDDDFWSNGKGLGISSPVRYHIQRGVVVRDAPEELYEEAPAVQPPPRNPKRTARRPASSVYSQPSPTIESFATVASRNVYSSAEDVSPPSSPEVLTPRDGPRGQTPEISPIDDLPDMSRLPLGREPPLSQPQAPPQPRSNIPMMRRDRRKQQDANTLRERQSRERLPSSSPESAQKGETKWDSMTGEPTTADRGRAGQVRPAEYAQGFGHNAASAIAQRNGTHSFGDRVRRLRPVGPPAPQSSGMAQSIDTRPEWKGASGRTTLVSPVRDTPDVAPLNIIPRKSSKRMSKATVAPAGPHSPLSPVSPSGSETSLNAGPLSIRRIVPSSQQRGPQTTTQQPVPAPLRNPASGNTAQAYPSPPNSGSPIQLSINAPHVPSLSSPNQEITSANAANANAHASSPITEKAIRRKPPPPSAHSITGSAAHAAHPSTSSSVYSQYPEPTAPASRTQPPVQQQHTGLTPYLGNEEAWTQPPSRFSVTTYATSATGSPRPSVDDDAPPVPAMPPPPSILDRKRPMVPGNWGPSHKPANEPIVISMNSNSPYMSSPFTTTNQMTTGAGAAPTRSNTDVRASISKALPPAPPEISSVNDRIAHLNAKLESLGNRRININRSIKQMTELMPTDSLVASEAVMRKREAEKRKVENLRTELAEVQREEYELGLKLHRAYKRMDRDAEFEPTTLWVRRVTN